MKFRENIFRHENYKAESLKKIVLASSNLGKIKEFSEFFHKLKFDVISQSELGIKSPTETGASFIENAIIKARHASKKTGLPSMADDSGLIVPALNGEPGVFSARYAGIGATDEQNNSRLIQKMRNFSAKDRKCYFVCILVFLRFSSDPAPLVAEGRWEGSIGDKPVGNDGFGYDPIFIDPKSGTTAAQLSTRTKMSHSHRGEALRNLYKSLALD